MRADMGDVTEAAKGPKLPKFKPIKFPAQTLGMTSAPVVITLPQTTGLVISSVTPSGDFSATDTCTGQPLPCPISVSFLPSKTGARRGTLTIANNIKTISVALSGTGVGPKVSSLGQRSLPPLQPLTINGSGFDTNPKTQVLVSFLEKIPKTKQSVVFVVAASTKTTNSVTVQVPPIFNPTTKEPVSGTAKLTVQEVQSSGNHFSSKSPSLQIGQPNTSDMLPMGAVTMAFLQAQEAFAMTLEQDVMGTSLSSLGTSLMSEISALNSLSMLLGNSNPNLGSIMGQTITESGQDLFMADMQILQMLNTMAGGTGSSAVAGAARLRRRFPMRAAAKQRTSLLTSKCCSKIP
jgi:hypothetical protein